MKYVMIFLVLTLVVLMAEPGECFFGRLKAVFRGARQGWKEHRYHRDMRKMAERYGPNWQQKLGGNANPQPEENAEDAPAYQR
uniref:Piscidin 5 n=1 Tax=Oplegnathus fasciatus TaxID=163134 RepID=A0A2D3HJX2_OPLFA|nr:piscidin 5 [Oplegnathus fasciatus]